MAPRFNFDQIKAIFFIYLIMLAYAEESAKRLMLGQARIDANNTRMSDMASASTIYVSKNATIGHGQCDPTAKDVFVSIDEEIYQIRTPQGHAPCNETAMMEEIREMIRHSGPEDWNPTLIKITVAIIGGATFVGEITLAGAAGIALIGYLLGSAIYDALSFLGSVVRKILGIGDSNGHMAVQRHNLTLALDSPNANCGPCGCDGSGCPPAERKEYLHVAWSELGHLTQMTIKANLKRDVSIGTSCVQQIINQNPANSGGCCRVDMENENGYNYKAALGVATLGPYDAHFICNQEAPTVSRKFKA